MRKSYGRQLPSTTEQLNHPYVLFALRREAAPFCEILQKAQKIANAPCWTMLCGLKNSKVLVSSTGVGCADTQRALEWLLAEGDLARSKSRPSIVVAAGFCGALRKDLRTGDLILATAVIDEATGESWVTNLNQVAAGGSPSLTWKTGPMVTVSALASTPEQKLAHAAKTGAIAVDMESAAVARLCSKAGVPFAVLRVVVDEANALLSPRMVSLLSGGRVSAWRVAASVLTSPRLIGELTDLAGRSRLAADRLAQGLVELLCLDKAPV